MGGGEAQFRKKSRNFIYLGIIMFYQKNIYSLGFVHYERFWNKEAQKDQPALHHLFLVLFHKCNRLSNAIH